jgi:hypothetical protein
MHLTSDHPAIFIQTSIAFAEDHAHGQLVRHPNANASPSRMRVGCGTTPPWRDRLWLQSTLPFQRRGRAWSGP